MSSTGTAVGPLDLRFTVAQQFRPVDMIAPRFTQFDSAGETADEPPLPSPLPPVHECFRTGQGLVAPFGAVVCEVAEQQADSAVSAGWSTADGDALMVHYDAFQREVTITVTTEGVTEVVARTPVTLRTPYRLAATLTGTRVTAVAADDGTEGWRPLVTGDSLPLVDPRRPETLRGYRHTYGGRSARLSRVRAGYFGQVGLRDGHLVTYADGRPYRRDGRLLFTFGAAGMGFSQEAHWSVWALDPDAPERMEQVAKLFFTHDGLVTGDNAGQIVYDEDRDRFVLVVCGGNLPEPGVYVRHAQTGADILSGVHVIANEQLAAPVDLSSWEPAIGLVDGRWHIAYANVVQLSPELEFHPVLVAAAEDGDYHEGLTVRAADPDVRRTEGCVLHRFATGWHLLATDDAQREYRVYDLALRQVGTLAAPFLPGGPHPQVVPLDDDGRDWLLVTFANVQFHEDVLGYGTEGDVVIMRGHAARG
ncbi:hypothetical protein ACQPWW_26830 [Micromonospora sp. CA-240977]|uniref:hypothetical protein n=1 Tax=Micromonospora sp. CA-240977 TaxID=3239957 RepID=UPI003D947712